MSKHTVRRRLAEIQGSRARHSRRTTSSRERRRLLRNYYVVLPYLELARRVVIEVITGRRS